MHGTYWHEFSDCMPSWATLDHIHYLMQTALYEHGKYRITHHGNRCMEFTCQAMCIDTNHMAKHTHHEMLRYDHAYQSHSG